MQPLNKQTLVAKLSGVFFLIGCLLFINIIVITLMLYLRFQKVEYGNRTAEVHEFVLSPLQYWIFSSLSGLVAGILMNYQKPFISGFSGLITALLLSATTLLYFSWRQNIEIFEILFPLTAAVIPGIKLYDHLNRKYGIKSS